MTGMPSEHRIELCALLLTIPGSIASLATLWLFVKRHRDRASARLLDPEADPNLEIILGVPEHSDETTRRAADWFQHQYHDLETEFNAEQDEWTEEMEHLHSA